MHGEVVGRVRALAWALLGLSALGGCGGDDPDATLTVFAASSLTDAFGELGRAFEEAHPGTEVRPSFAGSQVLRLQIEQGAPADVYASADERHMEALVEAGLVEGGSVFAHNELVIIVPRDDPGSISGLEELPRAERLVIGDANVPVGRYTRRLLAQASTRFGAGFEREVMDRVVSEETNVRLVRAKVELGEADAAIVYRTDARGSDRLRVIPIDEDLAVRADYSIGVVSESRHPELARRWVELVMGEAGQRALEQHGFARAEPSGE